MKATCSISEQVAFLLRYCALQLVMQIKNRYKLYMIMPIKSISLYLRSKLKRYEADKQAKSCSRRKE